MLRRPLKKLWLSKVSLYIVIDTENLRGGGRESMKSISCEVAWVLLYFMLSFISLKVSSVKLNFNLNLFKYASFSPCSALFESCD